jgi:hypothetical protein
MENPFKDEIVNESVKQPIKVTTVKVETPKVETNKEVIEFNVDKMTFKIDEFINRAYLRYGAKLMSDNDEKATFTNKEQIIIFKKI